MLFRSDGPRGPRRKAAHVGDASPAFFCCQPAAGLPSPPRPSPKGVVREAAGESGLASRPRRPHSGSPATADLGGTQPFASAAAKLWWGGASLAPPSQCSPVWGEEIPTWKRGGDWKAIRAGRQAHPGLNSSAAVPLRACNPGPFSPLRRTSELDPAPAAQDLSGTHFVLLGPSLGLHFQRARPG